MPFQEITNASQVGTAFSLRFPLQGLSPTPKQEWRRARSSVSSSLRSPMCTGARTWDAWLGQRLLLFPREGDVSKVFVMIKKGLSRVV